MKAAFRNLLVVLLAALILAPAEAQAEARLESLEIAIWPEYDRPSALVIYRARLDPGTALPATIELPIPASVGTPHAVAAWYPDGTLDDRVTWTREVVGDVAMITVETEASGVWLEYYAPLEVSGETTRFTFTWPGGVAVGALSYDVKHPLGALRLQVVPPGEAFTAEDGYAHTRTDLGAFPSDESVEIELSYEHPARPEILPAVPYTGNPTLERLDVGIWPEYDRREALVILEGTLPADVPLPARIALPIPPSAGEPFAVAQVGQGSQLLVAPYEREILGDWAWVVVESESRVFQVEYYTPLTFDGQLRSFSFYWPGGVDLGQLTYGIQHPAGATNMLVVPPGAVTVEQDGLTYTSASLGPRTVQESALISFEYSKAGDTLTVDSPPPSIDRPDTTTGSTPILSAELLPWILGIFGSVLVLTGVLLFMRTRREERAPRKRVRGRSAKASSAQAPSREDVSPVFCHVCGTQAGASDVYCRRCGAELRK